jgi:hypothetical protein
MDTLSWIQYNRKITVSHTTKKYFGKYLYKLVVYSPAGRIITDGRNGDVATQVEHRKTVSKNINAGYWGYRNNKELDNASVELLTTLRDIKKQAPDGIKFRVEEPRVQIYSKTDKQLLDLVDQYLKPFADRLESVSGPEDSTAEAYLNSGAILRKTDNGYQHKVVLRDGRYSAELKYSLYNYIKGLPDETVYIPSSTRLMLTKDTGFMWNCYFFVNDLTVLTFVNLIAPGIILNTHQLVVHK